MHENITDAGNLNLYIQHMGVLSFIFTDCRETEH